MNGGDLLYYFDNNMKPGARQREADRPEYLGTMMLSGWLGIRPAG
jgi:hypothetical protein